MRRRGAQRAGARRVLAVLCLAAVAGCGMGSEAGPDQAGPGSERAAVMAAAIEELVSEDHTFGAGPPPFSEYLIQSQLDPAAGTGLAQGAAVRPLDEEERAAIEDAVSAFGPVRWIDDPDEWRTADLRPTIEGAVILGVGEPTVDGGTGTAPVSLWCGGTCGTWITYRLERTGGTWQVTGTDGPVAIS